MSLALVSERPAHLSRFLLQDLKRFLFEKEIVFVWLECPLRVVVESVRMERCPARVGGIFSQTRFRRTGAHDEAALFDWVL